VVELVNGVGALREQLEEHTAFFPFLVQLAEEAEQDELHVAQVVGEALEVHEALADGPRLDAPPVGALGIGRVVGEAPELRAVVQVVPREAREVMRAVGLVLDVAAILHNQVQFLGRERVTGIGLRARVVRAAVAVRARGARGADTAHVARGKCDGNPVGDEALENLNEERVEAGVAGGGRCCRICSGACCRVCAAKGCRGCGHAPGGRTAWGRYHRARPGGCCLSCHAVCSWRPRLGGRGVRGEEPLRSGPPRGGAGGGHRGHHS